MSDLNVDGSIPHLNNPMMDKYINMQMQPQQHAINAMNINQMNQTIINSNQPLSNINKHNINNNNININVNQLGINVNSSNGGINNLGNNIK